MPLKVMAKNVFQKKKRISHFQAANDNFIEGENVHALSGCFDYVSKIIENIDSNFESIHSNCSKNHGKRKSTDNDGQKNNSSNKCTSSPSKGLSGNSKNFKRKLLVSRKFPLMEKSQKILKQIKHNRSISKPRAHLAALPMSPIKADTVKMSNMKKKNQNPEKASKLKNNHNSCNATISNISHFKSHGINNKNFVVNNAEISKKFQKAQYKEEENIKSVNSNEWSRNKTSHNTNSQLNIEKNNLNDTKALKDSENETTDSEYERFVKKSKKGLQKKVLKRRKQTTAKSRAFNKKSKRLLCKNTLEHYDSGNSDRDDNENAPLSNNSRKVSPSKKQIVTHRAPTETETENVNEDSDPDTIVDFAQDSSLESDDHEALITDETLPLDRKALQKVDPICDSDSGSDSTLPDVSVFINKKNESETSHIVSENVVSTCYRPDVFSSHVGGFSDSGKSELNYCSSNLVIDLCDSDDDSKKTINEDLSVSASVEKKNKVIGGLIGLSKHGDDCKITASKKLTPSAPVEENLLTIKTTQNIISLDSEESDLEIIEVLPTKSKSTESKSDAAIKMPDCLESIANGKEKSHAVKSDTASNVSYRNSQLIVKTEKTDEAVDTKYQNIRAEDSKYEAVYMTNICNDFDQDKLVSLQSTLMNSKCSKLLEASSNGVIIDDTVLENVVKRENESDDDIVILNTVQTSNQMLPAGVSDFSFYKKIKTETTDILKESLKRVKCSAHNVLKMEIDCGLQSQNHSSIPMAVDGRNTIKNEHSNESLSILENTCPVECVQSEIKNPFFKDEVKSSEVTHSSSKTFPINFFDKLTSEENREFKDLEQMSEFHLIELYKKEFQTYQEIVQTEASVGASLKVLEIHQAEKVKYIQSLVQKYVGRDQIVGKTSVIEEKSRDATLFERKGINTFNDRPRFDLIDFSRDTENSASKISEIKPDLRKFSKDQPLSFSNIQSTVFRTSSEIDSDIKPNISGFHRLHNAHLLQQSTVIPKPEKPESSQEYIDSSKFKSNEKHTLKLLNEKCNVCGKEAMAACQSCAKVFFCSNDCGRKFWNDGHINECGK